MPAPKRDRRWHAPIVGAVTLLTPASAAAHTTFAEMGSFWSGVAHLLTSLDQVALFVGLAIWAGFQNRRCDAPVIGFAFAAMLVGAVVSGRGGALLDTRLLMAALLVAVGLAGAARWTVSRVLLLPMTILAGLVAGVESGDGAVGLSLALFALGSAIAVAALVSYGLIVARACEAAWAGIALRAGASWISAIGVMTLAVAGSRSFGHW